MDDGYDEEPESGYSPSQGRNEPLRLQLPATTDPPGPENPPKQLVWLIFGATGHMGMSVAKAALNHGDKVSSVGRTFEDTIESLTASHPGNDRHFGMLCDVRIRETVKAAIDKTMQRFGRIDVIANCSGYGVIGSCEDQEEYEIRNQFETNFMGTLNIIQLSLPYFRARQQGRYLIFSSTSGALGVPGLGPYCATKYAVEGLIESMLYEVDAFNIKMTLVEPGHIRRDDVHIQASGENLPIFGHFKVARPSEPYQGKDSPAEHPKRMLHWMGHNQPTSAVKSAELVWQLGHCSYPPLRLLLGTFAVDSIRDRLNSIIVEIEDWKHLNYPLPEGQEPEPEEEQGQEDEDNELESNQEQDEGPDTEATSQTQQKQAESSAYDIKMEDS